MSFGKKNTQTIKGIAILFLLFYHLFSQPVVYTGFDVQFLLEQPTVLWLSSFGNICVAIFLFLSAYGITMSYKLVGDENITVDLIVKKTVKRAIILILHFLAMYISVWTIWFSKFDYNLVYGEGKQSILFAITDALGLAEIFDTPTLCMTWWYMEIAILCIILLPIFQLLYNKIENLILPLLILIPNIFVVDLKVYMYVVVIALGLCTANGNWIEKIKNWDMPYIIKIVFSLTMMILTFLLRSNELVKLNYEYMVESFVAFVWVVCLHIIFEKMFMITPILRFLGKHSMNIFFFHTFIYLILYRNQVYGLRYAGVIFIFVLVVSLLYSLAVEFIKEKFGFYKLVNRIKGDL